MTTSEKDQIAILSDEVRGLDLKVEKLDLKTDTNVKALERLEAKALATDDKIEDLKKRVDDRADEMAKRFDTLRDTMAGSKRWTAVEIGSIGTVLAALLSGLGGIVLAANGKELPPVVIPAPAIERRVDEQAP